jgi:hypothetical protein
MSTLMRVERYVLAIWAAIAAGTAAGQPGPEPPVLSIRVLESKTVQAVVVVDREVTTDEGVVQIKSLKINPERNQLRLALPKNPDAGGSSLGRFKFDENALAAFTGGFLDSYSPATAAGLVRHDGSLQNELRSSDTVMKAVVCYADDTRRPVTIMDADKFSERQAGGDCIQTGPWLIKQSQPVTDLAALDASINFPFARKAFDRAFLLLDMQGNVVMGVSGRISLYALREVLRRSEQDNGFGAVTAVALSGTRSAGLIIGTDDRTKITAGNTATLLPNAVIVDSRKR